MNNSTQFDQVLEKYLSRGVIHGSEFLLPPKIATLFIDDLTNLGIQIAGIEIWQYFDQNRDPDQMLEIPGAGGLLDKYLDSDKNLAETGNVIKKFILTDMKNLIPEGDMVSLVFIDPEIYSVISMHQAKRKK
jgi:hypothetical protein